MDRLWLGRCLNTFVAMQLAKCTELSDPYFQCISLYRVQESERSTPQVWPDSFRYRLHWSFSCEEMKGSGAGSDGAEKVDQIGWMAKQKASALWESEKVSLEYLEAKVFKWSWYRVKKCWFWQQTVRLRESEIFVSVDAGWSGQCELADDDSDEYGC